MDSSIAFDPRFKLLAKRQGVDFLHAVGACWAVWIVCYERRSATLHRDEVDSAADLDGFAGHLVGVGLAHWEEDDPESPSVRLANASALPSERLAGSAQPLKPECALAQHSLRRVVIHGVDSRIDFLTKQARRGSIGGKSKKVKDLGTEANAKRTLSQGASERLANSPSLTPSLTPSPAPALSSSDGVAVAPAGGGEAGETPAKPKPPAKTRPPAEPKPPDPMWDAIVDVTGTDSALNGPQIGKLKKILLNAKPPYTPDEVREFGRRFHELCPWAGDRKMLAPTLGTVQNHLALVRTKPDQPGASRHAGTKHRYVPERDAGKSPGGGVAEA